MIQQGKFRFDHPGTAFAAALQITPFISAKQQLILDLIREHEDGLTDQQICGLLGLDSSSERPRRVELVELGFVHDSGARRETRSGRWAIVWKALVA